MKNASAEKKIVDKLVEECTKTVEEVKIAECNPVENKHKCRFCTLYIVLFSIIFTVNIGVATYFVYSHWYLKKDVPSVEFDTHNQTTIYEF